MLDIGVGKRGRKLGRMMLIVLLTLSLVLPGGFAAFANTVSARVLSIEGQVQVVRAGGERPFNAFVNMRLTEGDRIITGIDGTAKIQMDDDVEITIIPNSRVYLSELRGSNGAQQSSIGLQAGGVGSSVKKTLTDNSRFEIKTPTAVMGVRGTEFFTQYSFGTVDCRVVEGNVEITVVVSGSDPGSPAVTQTLTFSLAALQQAQFNEQMSPSEIVQSVSDMTLDGMPAQFIERVQEISQQQPELIPPQIVQQIEQAIADAIVQAQQLTEALIAQMVNNPDEFMQQQQQQQQQPPGIIFSPPGTFDPPPPPPPADTGGGGGGGTTPPAQFLLNRSLEVYSSTYNEIGNETTLIMKLTFNNNIDPNSLANAPFDVQSIGNSVTAGSHIGSMGVNPNEVLITIIYPGSPEDGHELEHSHVVITASSNVRDTFGSSLSGDRYAIYGADFGVTAGVADAVHIQANATSQIGSMFVQENIQGSLLPNRTITLTLAPNAVWSTAPTASLIVGQEAGLTIGAVQISTNAQGRSVATYQLTGTLSTTASRISFVGGELAVPVGASGDVVVTFGGTAGASGVVKVAEITEIIPSALPTSFEFDIRPEMDGTMVNGITFELVSVKDEYDIEINYENLIINQGQSGINFIMDSEAPTSTIDIYLGFVRLEGLSATNRTLTFNYDNFISDDWREWIGEEFAHIATYDVEIGGSYNGQPFGEDPDDYGYTVLRNDGLVISNQTEISDFFVAQGNANMAADKDALIPDAIRAENIDLLNVTENLNLINVGTVKSSAISWESTNESVVATDGTVIRPEIGAGDVTVTLTATIKSGSQQDTKIFEVTVLQQAGGINVTTSDQVTLVNSTVTISISMTGTKLLIGQRITMDVSDLLLLIQESNELIDNISVDGMLMVNLVEGILTFEVGEVDFLIGEPYFITIGNPEVDLWKPEASETITLTAERQDTNQTDTFNIVFNIP